MEMKEKLEIFFRKEKAQEEKSVFQPVLELVIVSVSTAATLTRHYFMLPSVFDTGQQAFSC